MSTEPTDSLAILESYVESHYAAQLTRVENIKQTAAVRKLIQRLHPEIMVPSQILTMRCMLIDALRAAEERLAEFVQMAESRFDDRIQLYQQAGILPQANSPQADHLSHGATDGDLHSKG